MALARRQPSAHLRRLHPLLLLLLVAATATPARAGEDYVHRAFGFRFDMPGGWEVTEEDASGAGFTLTIRKVGAPDEAELKLQVNPPGVPADAEQTQALVFGSLTAEVHREQALTRRSVAGLDDVPGLTVDLDSNGFPVRVRQAYLVEHGWLYLLQDVLPVVGHATRAEDADRVWAGLSFVELDEAAQAERLLATVAARCGSEIDWAPDWDTAAARAAERDVPVLVAFRRYPGFDATDNDMIGPFMDPDVIALVNSRSVPLHATDSSGLPFAAPERYGLGPATFGAALLLVDPVSTEVLWDGPGPVEPLLREAFAGLGRLAGTLPDADDPHELATAHAVRGELEIALELLGAPGQARDHLLTARVRQRQFRFEEALDALEAGDTAPGAEALHAELAFLRIEALMQLGRLEAARDEADALLDGDLDGDDTARALSHRGVLTMALESHRAAEPFLRRAVREHGDSRWAWQAAALLGSDAWRLEVDWPLEFPGGQTVDVQRPPRFEPLPVEDAARAADDALAWLLENQLDDGSWWLPSSDGRADEPADEFELAVTAHAILALLPRADDPRVSAAVEAAADWLETAYDFNHEQGIEAYYMDYSVWSRPIVLEAWAALLEDGRGNRRRLRKRTRLALDELAERAKPAGGWSYYLTGDLDSAPPQVLFAMSFTTAAAVLALHRAAEAGLLGDADELLDPALGSLERGRREDGSFEYMVAPDGGQRESPRGAGDSGRGPVCTLALLRHDRADADALTAALDRFVAHRGSYMRERGKHLMHAGTGAEGSHYLLFDYLYAAQAVLALAPDRRGPYVEPLLEAVLHGRVEDGSFVDNPIIGRAWGAAAGLRAIDLLLSEDDA